MRSEAVVVTGYEERLESVKRIISDMGSCAVCFSGGLDSTVLMDIAQKVLGDRAVAVTADVPMMAERQRTAAKAVADHIGCRQVIVKIPAERMSSILENRHDRCYICKTAMYSAVRAAAESMGIHEVLNGEIVDDLSEDRPGMAAGPENGIKTPFLDAGMTRSDIVRYLDGMGIPMKLVKDTCMLMRYPEGMPVEWKDMREVEDLEAMVRETTGLHQLRVRRTASGYSVQTSTEEYTVLEGSFGKLEELFAARGLHAELNPVRYDK